MMQRTIQSTILVLLAMVFVTGCTAADGEPWGRLSARLTVPSPDVSSQFEATSFAVGLGTVRLIETRAATAGSSGGTFDPANPPPGCNLCHGGHCHCDGELVPYDEVAARLQQGGGTTRRVIANVGSAAEISGDAPFELGEAAIEEEVTVDTVEVELDSVFVSGTLTRDGDEVAMTLSLPGVAGTRLVAPADLAFGFDTPQEQSVALKLTWPANWLAEVDIDSLETDPDGEILLSSTANRDAAFLVTGAIADSTLEIEQEE